MIARVRDVIASSGDFRTSPGTVWYKEVKEKSAQLEDTAQLFLGPMTVAQRPGQHQPAQHHAKDQPDRGPDFHRLAHFPADRRGPESHDGREDVGHEEEGAQRLDDEDRKVGGRAFQTMT